MIAPISASRAPMVTALPRPRRSGDIATCLVVDDEPRLRQALARVLEKDGYVTHQAASGAEALAVMQEQSIALVLSDLRMPGMDGTQLLRELRARYPDVAVVMISAVDDVDTAVHCLANGAMDYLSKPCHLEEVRQRIRQALERRRLVLTERDYHAELESRVAEQARRLESLFFNSIQSLADSLEAKDRYTRGHSTRVSYYSGVIAREMGRPADDIWQIELGGHVHDLGKIGVREAVLNKPGRLTDDEYEHIMTHMMVGWRILAPLLSESPMALNIVRWHHERYDGRGGPDRLAGEHIPLEARIAAVADSFDAMTSRRPYRPGLWMPLEKALEELRVHRTKQFDPDAVDAFLSVIERGGVDWERMGGTMDDGLGDGWPHRKPE
ncbi:MAG: response regulator [Gemmatimonadaceae bacterium]|nr:response regulator [Gemmatimonadaceae bacterium]